MEIAEAAKQDNNDKNEKRLMEDYMVQRLYWQFLMQKMKKEMDKYRHLEEAFQKIRTSTGNSDVQEIVNKFLTREQNYTLLLTAVNENEKTVDGLRKISTQREEELHVLAMASADNQEDKDLASSTTNPVGLEIQRLKQ